MRARTWIAIVAVAIILAVGFALKEYNRAPQGAAAMDAVLTVQATELHAAFMADEAVARLNYVGEQEQTIVDTVFVDEHPDPGYTVQVANDSLWTIGGAAWEWFFDGSVLVSDSASALATQTGAYHALVTDAYGCAWSTDTVLVVLNTSVEDAMTSTVRAFPIPTASVLFIDHAGDASPAMLLNASGQQLLGFVLRAGRNAVDVSGLAPGLYLMRAEGGEAVRVVVE